MSALMLFIAALGVWLLISALANWDWFNAIAEFASIEALFGEGGSRLVCGIAGVGLIAVAIVGLFGGW